MKKLVIILFSLILVSGCKNTPSSNSSFISQVSSTSEIDLSSSIISNSETSSSLKESMSLSNTNELDTSDVLGGNYGELH